MQDRRVFQKDTIYDNYDFLILSLIENFQFIKMKIDCVTIASVHIPYLLSRTLHRAGEAGAHRATSDE